MTRHGKYNLKHTILESFNTGLSDESATLSASFAVVPGGGGCKGCWGGGGGVGSEVEAATGSLGRGPGGGGGGNDALKLSTAFS